MTDKIGVDDLVARGATASDLDALPRAEMKGGRLRDPLVILNDLEKNPPPEVLRGRLKAFRELLNGADPLDRAVLRDPLIRRLETLGVRSAAKVADAALATDHTDNLQGRPLALAEPEPWPEPVDGGALLDEIVRGLTRFIIFPNDAAVSAVALWSVHTHAHDASEISPMLAVTSPVKRCGKTRVLTLVGVIVPRALSTSNISPSALFRTVEKFRPSLLVDEADTFLSLSDELRGLLNAGHTRSTAWSVRNVGDDHEPRRFSTWCPKVAALIGKLPDTLQDRSIEIAMRRRRAKGEKVERLTMKRLKKFEPLCQRAARWAQDHLSQLEEADPVIPEELGDRAQDNWRPLLAIADLVGGDWPTRARAAALALSGADQGEEDAIGIELLTDIRQEFESSKADRLASLELVQKLTALEERPWREWGRQQKPITQRQLAALLKPFGIRPKEVWIAGGKTRGYEKEWFTDAFSRYLPPVDPVGPVGVNDNEDLDLKNDPVGSGVLPDRKSGVTSGKQSVLPLLPDGNPLPAEEWGEV